MAEKEEEKKTTSKTTKRSEFKPGKKPAISTRKSKPKAKVPAKTSSENKKDARKIEKTEGLSFSQIIVLISIIAIVALSLTVYFLALKKNQLQSDLDTKNKQLQSVSNEIRYFKDYQDKMDNLIDQASELSDEAHAKDLFILENIFDTGETKTVDISDEELNKIKNVRDQYIEAYEDLDWDDVSKLSVNEMTPEQKSVLSELKIREITIKDENDTKFTSNGNVYYEINIVVRRKGNSPYNEGDNNRFIIIYNINGEYKVDLVDKIN